MTRFPHSKLAIFSLGVLTFGFTPRPVSAATATANIAVSANVLKACVITATPLAFGTYDPTSGAASTTTSTIGVKCTIGTSYQVGLNAGTTSGNTVTARKMVGTTSTANTLAYGIFQDAGYLTNWGNTTTTEPASQSGTGATVNMTAYGQIAANTSAPIDGYTDTVTATLTF
jgi:spore coat protein U-like protein